MRLSDVQRRPTLLGSCAMATTSAEASFRIDPPPFPPRASRVIALDEPAAVIVRGLAGEDWGGGHFLAFDEVVAGEAGASADARLRTSDGSQRLLSAELHDADVVVLIATGLASPEAASIIGDACADRMIMSAGLVLPSAGGVDRVVSALRPNAMVLVVLQNECEVPAILTALRV